MKAPRPSELWLAHLASVGAMAVLLCGLAALAAAVVRRLVS
ncbi:hypothetical protein [Variovorax paradoxus]|jgi:hypothetical protein|uniref:Uncharacterized protein n=1 Tax=Variovorax paradoxus TaxID=34073 RepID=A0A679J900_VARPD|nr:hypothetical protein VVAX_03622 [Variovorax paradoxus]